MASLIVMKGTGEGDFHLLEEGVNVIGRSVDLPIHLPDMTVSRKHVDIRFDPRTGRYRACDLGSTHGVFVNGRRVREDMHLVEGDCLTVGRIEMMFTKMDITSREQASAILASTRPEIPTMKYCDSSIDHTGVTGDTAARSQLHRFRRWAGADRTTLAIVFTDIIDSALLAHEVGNNVMEEIRGAHFARARAAISAHRGYEIKTNGDEFMVAFRTAVDSIDFALDVQADPGDPRLRIRAGAHLGPVVVENEDVQGAAVSYAARIIARAGGGGIWFSDEVKGHLDQEKSPHHDSLDWHHHPDCEIKGFPGHHDLWSVNEDK